MSVRTTIISVYVHLNSRDGTVTKVIQAVTKKEATYFTAKLLTGPLFTRQKQLRRIFITVSIRTEDVSISAQRMQI